MEREMINPDLSSYADYWNSIEEPHTTKIKEYQSVAGAYDALWKAIYLRTETKAWELDPKSLGSCDITGEEAAQGLDILIGEELIELRNRRSNESAGTNKGRGCPHHRIESGCSLGDLKSPYCLDYIDLYMDDEIQRKFGICLMPVAPYLTQVGNSQEADEDLTRKTVEAINQVREHVESFPVSAF